MNRLCGRLLVCSFLWSGLLVLLMMLCLNGDLVLQFFSVSSFLYLVGLIACRECLFPD